MATLDEAVDVVVQTALALGSKCKQMHETLDAKDAIIKDQASRISALEAQVEHYRSYIVNAESEKLLRTD